MMSVPTQLSVQTAMAAALASTALALRGEPARALQEVEEFMLALETNIEQRRDLSLKASVAHPDGFWTTIKVKCHRFTEDTTLGDILEWRHHAGDFVLFALVWRMYNDFLASGNRPSFFVGQMLPPAPVLKPVQSPHTDLDDLPTFHLEGRGEKRTRADDVSEMREAACKYGCI